MLTPEEELKIFRKVNGKHKVIINNHMNVCNGNSPREGYYNQGVSRVKLREYIEKEGLDFEYWKNL